MTPKTAKEKQDQRKNELQAAAIRDGFANWSQALTAWKNGCVVMVKKNGTRGKMVFVEPRTGNDDYRTTKNTRIENNL